MTQITTMPKSKNAAFYKWLDTLDSRGIRRWSDYYNTLGTAHKADVMLASDASLATGREITHHTISEWRQRTGLTMRSHCSKYDSRQRVGPQLNARRAKAY